MNCPDCATPVEYSGRGVLVDREGSGMRKHFCPPPPLELEHFDSCNDCGGWWVRTGSGPRLDMRSGQPHVCPAAEPAPRPRHMSVEPPASQARLRIL